jgi:glutathione S-transferase
LKASKIVKAQGIGIHKPEEIIELGKEDLTTLSELLADKPFFFGDEPSLVYIFMEFFEAIFNQNFKNSSWMLSSSRQRLKFTSSRMTPNML